MVCHFVVKLILNKGAHKYVTVKNFQGQNANDIFRVKISLAFNSKTAMDMYIKI